MRSLAVTIKTGAARRIPIRKLISLGVRCEVAFQVRQHSGDNTPHFFDWLITPASGLLYLIHNDFPAFRPEHGVLLNADSRNGTVRDTLTDVRFVHQFPRRGKLIVSDFKNHYPELNGKFGYLADRFRNTVREHPVCFVRRDLTEAQALEIESALRERFPDADMRFLYVNSKGKPFRTPGGHSVYLPAPNLGLGESIAWSNLLVSEALVDRPFRLATAEVLRANIGDNHIAEIDRHPRRALKEAMRVNPENPWFAHELGTVELLRRRFRRAARLADHALALAPEHPPFVELRLRALLGGRRISTEEGLAETKRLLERAESSSLAALAADLEISRGHPDQALSLLDAWLHNDPHNDELHALKARALLLLGRMEEAAAAIETALALHPRGKRLVALKARILCALGRRREAHQVISETLHRKPSLMLHFLRAGLVLGLVRGPGTA